MTILESTFPKAFSVRFRDLSRFDPASFHGISWKWPNNVMFPIGSALKIRKEKVDRSQYEFSQLQPITIHFDGSIDKRNVEGNRSYSMELFFARPRDIVVAKLDLKNGAVGIVPGWENVVVTNHFAVYEPDTLKIIPEYFYLIIQEKFFKSYLWRNKVGAEGRKEVKLDFFESIEIPIPPIDEQKRIITGWQQAQGKAKQARERVVQVKQETENRFFNDLGLRPPQKTNRLKSFAVWWTDFERWSVSYSQATKSGMDIKHGLYPIHELGALLELVQYGTSDKANTKEEGKPVLRINNIKNGVLDLSDLKYISLTQKAFDGLLLKDGDILIIRTNGSRDLVGTCATFHEKEDFIFASYLIRLRVIAQKADPDFVSHFLNSELGRQQINAISRQIMQNNINSEELRSLQVPLPPIDVQIEIMARVQEGRRQIRQVQEAAAKIAKESECEIERMILGLSKI